MLSLWVSLALSLSFHLSQGLAASVLHRRVNACNELSRSYPNSTIHPGSSVFAEDVIEPWSQTCQTTPICVFAPASAEEVAGGLAILRKADQTFAVRTQGHMPVPGAADISNGVLMVTTSLNSVQYADDSKSVVQIGAGNRWLDVYKVLAKDSLGVAGGRFGQVGVSGLLLGGGISYFNSDHGWGANSVVNYEVVLANGTVCAANAQQNSDLYWALKGGAFNFGIVTRFDLTTFSVPYMWGGSAYYDASALDPLVNAYASYAVASGGSSDPAAHSDPSILYNVTTGEVSGYGIYMHRGDDPAPAALKNFTDIPSTFQDFRVGKTILGLENDTNPVNFGVGNRRQLFSSTALASSAEAVYLINQTFFDVIAATPQIKTTIDLSVTNTYQLFTPDMIRAAKASGGDPIGLYDPLGNGVLAVLYGGNWADAKDDETIYKFFQNMIDELDNRAKKVGLYYDFVYLNDAAPTQTKDIFQKFSNGTALPKLRGVAKSYDPDQVFQTLTPGGFKLINSPA
ncbi:FAD-binding, type 2 [Penicillium camemberti]|uniref:FAD-binding, type 2 n=1 Tax=Penicillium camemberti (strain FM 013) TaxID=1429867 RepID=A0A0G4NXU4_PENC3|nr:FAD-binding, type 2 [Penicillium camemberti]